jgi:signal transduction histidine kinase/ActR/RegA family two-component response regulator/HPt (histidine-containing phosphotransfer) domain-containing protein
MTEYKIQILVVEDDDLDRMIIKRALKESEINYDLFFADDHESGKKATDGKEYDCIFLDYNLPGGTGLELLKAIRAKDISSPIIIVTSQGDEKIAVEAMKLGANDYIPKDLLTTDGISQSVRYMVALKEQSRHRRELENQLKETQKQLNTVVANAPIILFSLNKNAEFRLIEGKGLEGLEINKDILINKALNENIDLPISLNDCMRAMNGEAHTAIIQWKEKFFEIFYSPIRDEEKNISGVLGIASDITEHKQAEQKLKDAKQLAEETAKIKEQFLANMSHEIRTPMNGIIGLTRILLNTTLTHEQLRYMQSIRSCSNNLLVIINDILDFSKIEAGKMNFETVPFRIDDLANQAIELFQVKADEKSIQLVLEKDINIPACVNGDPTRLSQILNNLISNAIKFTEKGEVRMKIHLTSKINEDITVCFEVKDSGIGIPEKSLPSIFDSFTQASSDTTRKFGGTGLGLTIVKRLIELQQGDIQVKSKPGLGTTFTFTLPFTIAKEKSSASENTNDHDSTSHLRILIAEDNKVNQLIIKKVFSDWKTYVEVADNGAIALEMLRSQDFDLILMDIQMPEMDGYTAVKKIRTEFDEPKRSIAIMAMTAHATSSEKQKCIDAGMDQYISKPFEPFDLKNKILELTKNIKPALHVPFIENKMTAFDESKENSENKTPTETDGLLKGRSKNRMTNTSGTGPKINLTYLKRISDGNDAFIIEMIEMFLNKTPLALEEMNECFKKQNWEELRKIAHRIRPSFAYIGMPEIQTTLAMIESWSEEKGDKSVVSDLMNEVEFGSRKAFEQLREELTTLK